PLAGVVEVGGQPLEPVEVLGRLALRFRQFCPGRVDGFRCAHDGPGAGVHHRRTGRRVLRGRGGLAVRADPPPVGDLDRGRAVRLVARRHDAPPSSTLSPSTTSPSPDPSPSPEACPAPSAGPPPDAPAAACCSAPCCEYMAWPIRWNACISASVVCLIRS